MLTKFKLISLLTVVLTRPPLNGGHAGGKRL